MSSLSKTLTLQEEFHCQSELYESERTKYRLVDVTSFR